MQSAEEVGHGESLEQVKDRLALWRLGRKPNERIPNALWAAAVGLVEQHGLQRTAQALCVDCGQLERRAARGAGTVPATKAPPQFVELFAQPAAGARPVAQCVVEMQNARGGKMRVELGGIDGLAGLASAFWSAR